MPISVTGVEIVLVANIETNKITTAKYISAVTVQSPIPDMTTPAPREIVFTKENKFTIDIHNDKADKTIQHQELETGSKQYNDEHGKGNSHTVFVGPQENVSVRSDWLDEPMRD
jgi:hypothetical protein